MMIFCTVSSRADTARTRRRLLRPALAPAPLRERAGRLARDMVCLGMNAQRLRPGDGGTDCAEPPPPASSPLRVPIRPAPPLDRLLSSDRHRGKQGHVRRGRTDRE
jgi:hypothetical protein